MIISLDNIDKNYYCVIKYCTNCRKSRWSNIMGIPTIEILSHSSTNTVDFVVQSARIERWPRFSKGSNLWPFCLAGLFTTNLRAGPSTDEAYVQTLNKKGGTSRCKKHLGNITERRAHPWIPRIFWVVEKQSSLLAAFYSGDSCGQQSDPPHFIRDRESRPSALRAFISGDTLLENRRPIHFDPCLFFRWLTRFHAGTRRDKVPLSPSNRERRRNLSPALPTVTFPDVFSVTSVSSSPRRSTYAPCSFLDGDLLLINLWEF